MTDFNRLRVEEIYYLAIDFKDHDKRREFLNDACAGDSALRSEVETMLRSQQEVDHFFSESLSGLKPARETLHLLAAMCKPNQQSDGQLPVVEDLGKRLGPYKLAQKIGEGGWGIVYLAEQEVPMRRQVALKIIKLGMDTKSIIARFEAERQALAMMDHPNIARVFDAGATETGRPYFVMELVRGSKITDYCDEHRLDIRQRLNLFVQVCSAVQHAHQKGIIHRDIKPSNVLVTILDGMPLPKVIDFGIAKATGGVHLTDRTMFTAHEQMIGTPAYMSPEQAEMNSPDDIDTRSDIYSLGVLLYELLTGKTPFDQKELLQSGLDRMRRTIKEREPQRPSTKLDELKAEDLKQTAIQRKVEPPTLKPLIRGDLDWIVMKALEKDRHRRYQTANELGIDIQRYVSHEPVVARPPSRVYRLQKLVRRNRVTFVGIAAVTMALIIGIGTLTWLFFNERELRREAEQGRANESLLRQQAEARERIAQAIVLLDKNRLDEADQMVGGIASSNTAMVGEAVFRTLGEWAAMQGHWQRASEYFSALTHVDRFETSDPSTLDHTKCAVSLLKSGDKARYDGFCQETIQQFGATTDPLIAERTVKNALLLPADTDRLKSLAPLADLAALSFPNSIPTNAAWMFPWRCVSLSLWEYRRGNYRGSIDWGNRCLGYGDDSLSRTATIHAIRALAYHRLGQSENAHSELALSRELIDATFKRGLVTWNDIQGYWFDWVLGQILEQEAIVDIEGPSQSLSSR
ncbi:MAG TPA: serine/threonine-protein kinase [Verrucomicrobiae bacterium]|nr:serine/threonine-protein kinase [Verrucomicrobiae bacterium]